MSKVERIDRGIRSVLVVTNQAGTVIHTMIEKGLNRAYIYKDIEQSSDTIEMWLERGMVVNPSDCIPYYG